MTPIRVKLTTTGFGFIPDYAHGPEEDAGMDLRSTEQYNLAVGERVTLGTGISIELPPGYEAQVRPRGGLTANHGIVAHFGTIDPGYRGEIHVVLFNHGRGAFFVKKGMKVAQLVVARYEAVVWDVVTALSDSARGNGGFGSTGL